MVLVRLSETSNDSVHRKHPLVRGWSLDFLRPGKVSVIVG